MSVNLSTTVRNARLDAIETAISTAPLLRIYSGTKPTACADAATGTLLAEMTLPSDWLAAASSGSKAKSGTWSDASANAAGTAGYFRIYDSTGTTCHAQGTVTATGGGGDMTLDNTSIASGQVVTITSFTLTDGNA
jgi:cytochrome c5